MIIKKFLALSLCVLFCTASVAVGGVVSADFSGQNSGFLTGTSPERDNLEETLGLGSPTKIHSTTPSQQALEILETVQSSKRTRPAGSG